MTFEQRMAELGVDLSDIKSIYDRMIEDHNVSVLARNAYLADIIDRMETRLVNLTGERDYLLRLYGFDCEECKRYDECNRDGGPILPDYCERDLVENWAGVPEDWRPDA